MNSTTSTLHLARLVLPYETAAKRGIHDPYHWHQRAWDAFPGRGKEERAFLTRIDQKDHGWQLLLLSGWKPVRPDWCPDTAGNWGVRAVGEEFLHHPVYRFSLRANPVRKPVRRDESGERLRHNAREPLKEPAALREWLARQGDSHGFKLVGEPMIEGIDRIRFTRPKDGRSGVHHQVDFSGVLRPTDPEAFVRAFAAGIGPAKAFGFGMLCLSPLL